MGRNHKARRRGLIQSSISPLFLSSEFIFPWKFFKRAKALREPLQFYVGSQRMTWAVSREESFLLKKGAESGISRDLSAGWGTIVRRLLLDRIGFNVRVRRSKEDHQLQVESKLLYFLVPRIFNCKMSISIPGPSLLSKVITLIKSEMRKRGKLKLLLSILRC